MIGERGVVDSRAIAGLGDDDLDGLGCADGLPVRSVQVRRPGNAAGVSEQHSEDLADGGRPGSRFGQRDVSLYLVTVPPAVFRLHHVPGQREVGNDAVGRSLGDVQAGGDVAQSQPWVTGDAQQHAGVVGSESSSQARPQHIINFRKRIACFVLHA
jgi:hypothetical protein